MVKSVRTRFLCGRTAHRKENCKMNKVKWLSFALILTLLPGLFSGARAAQSTWICKRGDSSSEVLLIQERLRALNYLESEPGGQFDEETENAVMAFQRRNDLLETGMVDSITWKTLFSDDARPALAASEADDAACGGAYEEVFAEEDGLAFFSGAACAGSSYAQVLNVTAKGHTQWNTNEYAYIRETGFQSVSAHPLSTFAADVDTASYAQLRSCILSGAEVPADAVRIEEMLNYFHYDYTQPEAGKPFGVSMALAPCPWNEETLLLQVGLQAETVMPENRPAHNLVFLIDVSGSMFGSDRLDLVKRAFHLLLDVLEPTDTISLVTYASRDEVVLSGVPAADKTRIAEAIDGLEAGGSTNSAAGIRTAYDLARQYAIPGGVNRILMATDGDFNVGMTSEGELARLVMKEKENGTQLTMLGVGYGNYKDNKLEALADYGDGNYYYLDTVFEARRALVTEAGGTLVAVARDVKLQLDFNPAKVSAYRLIGYEDRLLAAEDFADDTRDGGELGSGHTVTALYELVPSGSSFQVNTPVSRYQTAEADAGTSGEWLTLSIRCKKPGQDESVLEQYILDTEPEETMPENMRFASAVAEAGMLLRQSEFLGTSDWDSALSLARSCPSVTGDAFKEEFVYLLTLLQRRAEP